MSVNNVNLLIVLISTSVITILIVISIIEIKVGIKKYKGLRTSGVTKTWNFRFRNVKTRDWYEALAKMGGNARLSFFIKDATRCLKCFQWQENMTVEKTILLNFLYNDKCV